MAVRSIHSFANHIGCMDGYLLFYNETKDPLKVFLKGFYILKACSRSSTYAVVPYLF
jgi:hypothetical protein